MAKTQQKIVLAFLTNFESPDLSNESATRKTPLLKEVRQCDGDRKLEGEPERAPVSV